MKKLQAMLEVSYIIPQAKLAHRICYLLFAICYLFSLSFACQYQSRYSACTGFFQYSGAFA